MFRRVNQVVLVVLIVLGIAAALPTAGIFSSASCAWERDGPPPSTPMATPTLSMSLRAGDMAIANGLRERLEVGLKAGGVTKLVDNPLTYPRATVTVTAIEGRWTPFWARMKLQTTVIVDRARGGKGHEVEANVSVEGVCTGLVNRDEWQAAAIDRLSTEVLAQLASSTSTTASATAATAPTP